MRTSLGSLTFTLSALLLAGLAPAVADTGEPVWSETVVDADQSFRGLDAVDRRTAWVSGASTSGGDAKVYRTTDGGETWVDVSPPGSADLNFRDVEASNGRIASVLAIGPGEASRIYRTSDGGGTWTETFRNPEPTAFYNCMDFWPGGRRGLAVSDPVDGKFRVISTDDGGRSWEVLPDAGMPDSTGEYNFSASGDCLVVTGHRDAWFASGGAASRVFHSADGGATWTATDSGIPAGEAAGVFALAFTDRLSGIAVGGDFVEPGDGDDATALTDDGATWTPGGDLTHLGEDASYAGGSLFVTGESGATGGSSVSHDGGLTWQRFSTSGFHTLDCTPDGACWAAGARGRVVLP